MFSTLSLSSVPNMSIVELLVGILTFIRIGFVIVVSAEPSFILIFVIIFVCAIVANLSSCLFA